MLQISHYQFFICITYPILHMLDRLATEKHCLLFMMAYRAQVVCECLLLKKGEIFSVHLALIKTV